MCAVWASAFSNRPAEFKQGWQAGRRRGWGQPMSITEAQQKAAEALNVLVRQAHQDGLEEGLQIAGQIRNYLTRKLDNEWQQQAREWADSLIKEARKE